MVGSSALQADVGARHADLGQAGADRVLAGDERGAAGGAALLAVIVGEGDALVGDAVDVGRAVAHLAAAVVADVPPADVVAPENEDVRFLRLQAFPSPRAQQNQLNGTRRIVPQRPAVSRFDERAPQPNGPIWNSMLTIAASADDEQEKRRNQGQRHRKDGLAVDEPVLAHRLPQAAKPEHELDVIDDAEEISIRTPSATSAKPK